MRPVHHARNNEPIDVAENLVEWFGLFRRLRRKPCDNRARLVVRRDAQFFDSFAEVRDPIRERVQLPAKFFRRRIAEIWLSIFHGLL